MQYNVYKWLMELAALLTIGRPYSRLLVGPTTHTLFTMTLRHKLVSHLFYCNGSMTKTAHLFCLQV